MSTPTLTTQAPHQQRFLNSDHALVNTHDPTSIHTATISDLVGLLWSWKWILCSALIAAGGLAYVASLIAPKKFDATITFAPTSANMANAGGGTIGTLASRFSGLASLAGISVTQDSKKWDDLAVLESARLTEEFISKNHLLPILYSKMWNSKTHQWRTSSPKKLPTLWKANELFKRQIREVSIGAKTGTITLTITWRNPVLAADWANGIVRMANDYLRARAIAETDRHIAYLTAQATETNLVGAKQAIYNLLEEQIETEMIARGTDQYAFQVLDPAEPPEKPSWPIPALWILLAEFAVILTAVFLAYIKLPPIKR